MGHSTRQCRYGCKVPKDLLHLSEDKDCNGRHCQTLVCSACDIRPRIEGQELLRRHRRPRASYPCSASSCPLRGRRKRKAIVPAVHNLIFVNIETERLKQIKRHTSLPICYIMNPTDKRPVIIDDRSMQDFIAISRSQLRGFGVDRMHARRAGLGRQGGDRRRSFQRRARHHAAPQRPRPLRRIYRGRRSGRISAG